MSEAEKKAVQKETKRFGFVGAIATAVDYTILNLLVGLGHLPLVLANVGSTSAGTVVSYRLNKDHVFDGRRHNRRKSLVFYLVIVGTGIYIIQNIVIFLVSGYLQSDSEAVHKVVNSLGVTGDVETFFHANAAKVCASFFSAIWNFFMLRRFVFVPLTDNPEKHI